GRITGQDRWYAAVQTLHKRLNDRLQAGGPGPKLPDAFIAEIVNPTKAPARLTLTASIDKLRLGRMVAPDQLPRPVAIALEAAPGFSRQVLGVAGMAQILGSGLPFNLALTPAGGEDLHLIFRRLDLVALAGGAHAGGEASGNSSSKPAKL